MGLVVGLVAIVLLSIALPVLDRLTDAPIMRRDVNVGTRWWQLRERQRQREDPAWPTGLERRTRRTSAALLRRVPGGVLGTVLGGTDASTGGRGTIAVER